MNTKKAFLVLGIEETKDEEVIRAAYRSKLPKVNPEENQEGFRKLREAYEAALSYCKKKEEKKEALVANPVSSLISRVDEIYHNLPKRLDLKQWENLLKEDIFNHLELVEEVKREFFSYLSVHFRLTAEVWKLLSDFFYVPENEQEFKEYLPVEFVDFILHRACVEENYDFPLKKFNGKPNADYDGFITDFNELLDIMAQKEGKEEIFEKIENKIEELEQYGIDHPWVTLEKAKYALMREEKEEAERLLMTVWQEREGDSRILFAGATILKACGREKEAEEIFREFAKREVIDGDVYASLLEMTESCLKRQEFEEAKKYGERARKRYISDKVEALLEQCNLGLIDQYTSKEEKLTQEEEVSLCWAFLRTKREKEGLEYVKTHSLLTGESPDCHQIKSVLLLYNGLFEEAIEETRIWRESLSKDEPDNDRMRAVSLEQEGRALWSIWLNRKNGQKEDAEEEEKLQKLEKDILTLFEEALSILPEERNFLMSKLLFLRAAKRPKEVALVCEEMIRLSPDYFWSYYYAQEAHMELKNAQEVIDYFYQGRKIYAGEPKMYERAAQVFGDFRQYEDMNHILTLAREAGVSSFGLGLRELEYKQETSATLKECKEADEFAQALILEMEKALKENKMSEEDELDKVLSETYMERVYLHEKEKAKEIRNVSGMEKWLARAVELKDTDWNRYYKGRFYIVWWPRGKKAYRELKICENRGMDFGWMYYFLGRSQENAGEADKQEEAIAYFEKAYEYLPEERHILWRIADIYRRRFEKYKQIEDGEKALIYLDKQRQKFDSDFYDCWQYSRIYRNLQRWEEALKEIDLTLEKRYSAYNLSEKGYLLECMGEWEKAKEFYEKAILQKREETGDEDHSYAYKRIYVMFCKLKRYDEGILFFRSSLESLRTGKQKKANLSSIKNLYIRKKDWKNALKTIEEIYGHSSLNTYCCDNWEMEGERIEALLNLYRKSLSRQELKIRVAEAAGLLTGKDSEQLSENILKRFSAWEEVYTSYDIYLMEDEKALFYAKRALQTAKRIGKESEQYRRVLDTIMLLLWRMNRIAEAKQYAGLYRKSLLLEYEPYNIRNQSLEELHVGRVTAKRVKLYELFLLDFYCADYEKAETWLDKMRSSGWCFYCSDKDCVEEWLMKGFLALGKNRDEEALECFKKANECKDEASETAIGEIGRLEKKIREKERPK